MLNVDITKAGGCLPDLVDQSIDGNNVVITRNGKPVVKLVALTGKKRNESSEVRKG